MIQGEDDSRVLPLAASASGGPRLPYAIELWDETGSGPERVIGRAASMVLARAIFAAARTEHRGRRLVLRRGDEIFQDSGGEA